MRNTRLLPLLAALAFAPFIQAGIGDYPQAAAPDAPSGKEWESERRLGLNKGNRTRPSTPTPTS